MTLWDMLDKAYYYQNVLIYSRNAYDQCMKLFFGTVSDARRDEEMVWDYLPNNVSQWVCGSRVLLIFVNENVYEKRLEEQFPNSENWTRENRPYKTSLEAEKELESL